MKKQNRTIHLFFGIAILFIVLLADFKLSLATRKEIITVQYTGLIWVWLENKQLRQYIPDPPLKKWINITRVNR